MSLTSIQDLDNIIIDYKNQLEITGKYNKCINGINKLKYDKTETEINGLKLEGNVLINGDSKRFYTYIVGKLVCLKFEKNKYKGFVKVENYRLYGQ